MVDPRASTNGHRPDRSRSRFFRNRWRQVSLICIVVAFAAIVIGGGFAEISTNGAPTTLETAVVRWVVVGAVVIGLGAYLMGGRTQADGRE